MKELSIEEKAKRFDESIARAKKLMETCNSTAVVGWCEYIFKELKFFESEDEKIRKSLIDVISEWSEDTGFGRYNVPRNEVLAWLEKQKPTTDIQNLTWEDIEKIGDFINTVQNENPNGIGAECLYTDVLERFLDGKQTKQKPINYADEEIVEAVKDTSVLDMVESKLKAGQWIIDTQDGEILHINKVLEHAYEVTNLKGGSYEVSRCCIETWNKPWTIQDAEDGDVLFSPSHNLLWLHKDEEQCHACINLNYNDSLSIESDFVTPSDVSPAIKEQRDLLFQKIKEAGYEWDADKKELRVIIDWSKHIKYEPNSPSIIVENWSEEDDKMLIDAIGAVGAADYYTYDDKQEIENWLKSLKEKLHPQWKPSDEQIQALQYQVYSTYKGSWQYRASKELLEQLKKF